MSDSVVFDNCAVDPAWRLAGSCAALPDVTWYGVLWRAALLICIASYCDTLLRRIFTICKRFCSVWVLLQVFFKVVFIVVKNGKIYTFMAEETLQPG